MEVSPTWVSSYITNYQSLVTIFLLCATRKHHPLRTLNIALLTILTAIHIKYIHLLRVDTSDDVLQRITPLPTLLHTIVLLSKIDYEDLRAQHKPQYQGSRSASFWAAARVTLDWSAVGTRWQVRNVAEMPGWLGPNPRRYRFVLRQLAIVAWQYLMLDFVQSTVREDETIWNELISVLLDPAGVARHSWLLEAVVNIIVWFVLARLSLDVKWRAASIVAVGLGISEPTSWLPMFGGSLEAYTVRRFWGKYWHQQLRWPLVATASFITRTVFCLSQPSTLERYTNMLLCFFISGLIHLASQYKGPTFEKSGAVEFFTFSAVAIMVEDCVQALWARLSPDHSTTTNMGSSKKHGPGLWKRLVGFVWVLSFLVVIGPFYTYDMGHIALIESLTLTINFTELLTVPVTALLLVAGMLFGIVFLGAEP